MSEDLDSLVGLLCRRRRDDAGGAALTFLRDGERDEVHWTYEDLHGHALRVAAALRRLVGPGERALLVYPPGLDFLAGFFGCLYAGVVAVPACAPRARQSLAGLAAIAGDCGAAVVLTTRPFGDAIRPRVAASATLSALRWLDTDASGPPHASGGPAAVDGGSLAYLQYTSGSTSAPKGVMVTHGNVMANQRMIREATGHSGESVYVGWLPLHHDMGLVSMVLQALYLGARCVLLPPLHFLQKPIRWLRAISRYAATTSGAPDFAYDLCVRTVRPEQLGDLDLSRWSVAYSSAEPVRAGTLERFAAAFGPCGFRRASFFPCYGLAEATVFVTGGGAPDPPVVRRFDATALERGLVGPLPRDLPEGRSLVGCGRPWPGEHVLIVDPERCEPCPGDRVGEIWVEGPNVARGYWGRPRETRETFGARLADGGAGTFLRTSDLGFFLDGQLFVTGRRSDLIIIRGSNHHPQDIEATVQGAHPALRPGCGAAFAAEIDGEERLIVVQEVHREHRAGLDAGRVVGDIREAITAEHGLRAHAVVLIRTASIPRTTSGKVRRLACREALRDGALEVWGADFGDPDCRRR